MNKVFRIVWSEARQAWLVVSELTKIKGKSKAESQGQDIQSAVAFSSIFSSFPFHLLPHIVLLGLFSLSLPAEAAWIQGGGSAFNRGDENTIAIMGKAGPGSIAIGGGDGTSKANATGRTSVAIGYKADTGNYDNAVAVGNLAKGLGNSSVAIGDNATINGAAKNAVVIGHNASTIEDNRTSENDGVVGGGSPAAAVAIGDEAKAAYSSVAIGASAKAAVSQTIAIGDKANATHNNAIAIGVLANATNNTANAIGYGAKATGDYAFALGSNSTASAKSALAVNYEAKASGEASIALGRLSNATGLAAAALSAGAQALADRTIAIGENKDANGGHSTGGAKASADDAISIGTSSAASGKSAVAMGREANATLEDAVALGHNATATENSSTALGAGTKASNYSAIAIGSGTNNGQRTSANATAQNAIAIGGASASGFDSIAMGYNSTAGGNSTRQIAIGRDAKALEAQSVVLGSNSTSNASGAIALGSDVIASGYSSIAIGGDDLDNTTYQEKGGSQYINTASAGKGSVAIGAKSKANSDGSVVLGVVANATGNESMALGALSHANGTQTVALGASSNATAEYAIAIGSNASAASHSVAVGKNSVANQTGTTALGESSFATKERATALGNNSNATIANGSVAIGYQSVTTKDKGDTGWKQASSNYSALSSNVQTATHAAVAIGNNSTVTRQITGLAAGSADTDAVNVAQLKSLTLELKAGNEEGNVTLSNEKLEIKGAKGITTNVSNNVVTVTGSGLTVTPDSNGTYSSDTSKLDIKTNDAWNAENNGGRYSGDNIETRKTSTGILIGIKEEPTFKKVTINGNGPVLSSTGIAMNNHKISGLQAGTEDTDAVNKKQLDDSIGSTTYKAQHGEQAGYTIKHNQTKTITIKPGDISNGGTFNATNLATSVDNQGNITIGFKDSPTFKDVTASNSIKVNNGPTINTNGIDMGSSGNRKITNLANGTDSNDAVNFSQLQEVKNSIQNLQGGNVKVQSTSPNQITATKEGDTIKVGAKVVDDIETGADGKASLPKNYDKHALVTANATMAAVNDASWLVKTTDKSGWNSQDWAYINPGDNVVYANGTGTTAEVSNKAENGKDTLTVKVNVNTGQTEVDSSGKAKPKNGDTDKDKIATLGDITKTINETSWTVTSDLASGGSREGDAKEEKVKAGDKVTLKAGDNLKITQDGKSFTYALTKNLNNISSISNGADNVGTKIILSPTSKNIDVDGANISNVGKPIHSNDAANKGYVDELAGKGITFQANTNKTRAIKLGDTVDIVGANTNQITTTADGNGKVSIGAKTIRVDIGEYGRAQLAQVDLNKGGKGESLVTADTLVRAINEAGFLVKTTDQSGDPDTKKNRDWAWISPGYRVVYENGTGTTVSVSQTKDPQANVNKNTLLKVKVDVNTGNSTVNSDGKAAPATDDDKDKIATIGNITDTINKTYWKATSGAVDGGQNVSSSQAQIKAGDMVTFNAGKNMKITQDGSTFTYALMDNLSNITSISNGGDSGTKITLSPNEKNVDVGGAKITNVSNPTDNNDVVNKKYVDDLSKDLGNKGITFVSDGDKRTKAIKLGEQLKIVGANPKQITTTANENGTISIGAKTIPVDIGEDGRAFLPKLWTEQKGGDGENLVTANTVIRAINEAGFLVKTTDQSGDPDTKKNRDWAWISPGYRVVYENGTGTTVSVSQTKDPQANVNKNTLLKVKVDVNTGNSTVNSEGKAEPTTEGDKDKIATIGNITDTINKTYWKATSGAVDGGQNVSSSQAQIKAGDMVTLQAGKNMKITQEDKSFTYALKEAIDLTSVTTGNTSMNNDGITIKAPANAQDGRSNVTLTANGLDNGGNKITHVADGEIKQDSKDTVNGSQLYTVQEEAKKHTSVKAKDGQQIVTVEKSQQKNTNGGDEYVVSVNTANINVKYKANGQNEQSVSVDKGFNFTDTDNIAASVGADGVVKHALKSALVGVTSITAKKVADGGEEATKITLSEEPNDKKVTLNTAKITGLNAGEVSDSSTDAINGKQLHNLVKVNGNAAEKNGSVNFVNSTTTNVSAGNDGNVTVNVNNTTLAVNNGKVTEPSNGDKAKFVNAGDLATTLNGLGFNVTTTGSNLSQDNQTGTQLVKVGDTVQFEAGENLLVGRTDKKFTYRLASNLSNITSISNGGEKGTKITLSPDEKKIDVGGARITNVSNPTDNNDVVNKKYVDDLSKDLGNKGITFVSDGDKRTKAIKLGEQLKIVGANPKQITTTANENGTISIGAKTIPIDIGVDGRAHLAAAWKNTGDKENLVTADAVINAINNAGFKVKTTDGSGVKIDGVEDSKDWAWVSPGYKVVYENGNGTTFSVSQQKDKDADTQLDTLLKVKVDVNTGTSTVDNNGKAKPKTEDDKKKIATLEDITNTINGTFWKATSGTVDGGFQDGQVSVVNVKAGDMLTFKAGKNLKVKQDSNSFIYSLNDALSGISSISNGDDGVGTKITLSDKEKKVDVGGATIGNVGTPTQNGDATNKEYVDRLVNAAQNFTVGADEEAQASGISVTKEQNRFDIVGAGDVVTSVDGRKINVDLSEGIKQKIQNAETKGITFVADGDNKTKPIKLGDELKVTGASNIKTSVSEDGSALNVELTDEVKLSLEGKVIIGPKNGKHTTLEYDGLTIKTGEPNAKDIAVTKDGIKAGDKKITDVADGNVSANSKEAVNGGQLHNLVKVNNVAAENNGSANFITGDGTTVAAENGNIKVNVNKADLTTDLTVGNDGKVVEPTGDENKAKFVSAEKIAKSINDTFWKVTSGTDGGSEAAGSQKAEQQIKAGDMVSLNAGKNLTIKQDGANFTFALSDTLKIDNLNVGEKGADGKPGEDGKISVNGKDGSSVMLNGKDGSIGLNGKDGKDGVTIKSADGAAGLDGKAGEHKTRIVYERKDPKDPSKTITEEVATLEDGQQYSADNYAEQDDNTVIKKKLNQRLEIKGGADGSKLTDNNIGVIVDSGVLRVKLAQQINLGNEGALITGRTKVNNDGITITPATSADGSTKKPVSLSENGLDNGGNRIVNVADGVADSDAVNKGQLTAAAKGAKTEVQSDDSSIEVTETQGKDKQTIYDLSVVKSGLTVSDDKRTLKADKAGNAFVTGETVATAVNIATAAARTEVTSDNGSITLDPTVGKNGQEIYDLAVTKSNLTISPDGKTVSADKQGEAFVTGANVADMLNKAVASARTAVEGGTNVQVSAQNAPDGHDIYTVSVEGDLTNISSISNDGTQISLGKDDKGNKAVNVNGAKISGVADGVADSDAVNMRQLTAAAKGAKTEVQSEDSSIEVTETQGKDKQTIYDLSVVKSGLTVSDDKRTLTADKAGNAFVTGETVASAVNTATAAARTEVVEGKNIQVVEQTGEHGQNVYNLSISGLPMEYVTTDNKPVVNMGGKFYLEEVKDSGEVKLTPVVNNNGKFLTQTINPDGTISLNPIQVKVNLANETPMQLGNIADGTADNDAVNVRQLKATKTEVESTDNSVVISERQGENKQTVYNLSVAKTGLRLSDDKRTVSADFAGNHFATGEEVAKAINATAAAARTEVIGGTNVKVKTEIGEKGQNRYTLSVSGDLTDIHSISNGDTKLSLGKDNEGNPVVNVNGARVSNVADARADGDAINAKQLKNVVNAIGAGMDRLSRDIQNVDSNARAGIAAAGAMANLPQVYLPGKSAVSISGAHYRGQSAYALGYSRTSDNGKWIIRASAANNTQQDMMVGAGVSYIW
ncbi:YadA-like family protein [[Pasteurella] aerogenes]